MRDGYRVAYVFPDPDAAAAARTTFDQCREGKAPAKDRRARKLVDIIAELGGLAGIDGVAQEGRVLWLELSIDDDTDAYAYQDGRGPTTSHLWKAVEAIVKGLKGKPHVPGEIELEAGRARLGELSARGESGFVVVDPLKDVTSSVDPDFDGEWTARLEAPLALELDGFFGVDGSHETRTFRGKLHNGLLRLSRVVGGLPAWRVGDVVVRRPAPEHELPPPPPPVPKKTVPTLYAPVGPAPRVPEPRPRDVVGDALPAPVDTVWLPAPYDGRLVEDMRAPRREADGKLAAFLGTLRGGGALRGVTDDAIRRALWIRRGSSHATTGVDSVETLLAIVARVDPRLEPNLPPIRGPGSPDERLVRAVSLVALAGLDAAPGGSDYVMGKGFMATVLVEGKKHTVPFADETRFPELLNAIALEHGRPALYRELQIGEGVYTLRILGYLEEAELGPFLAAGLRPAPAKKPRRRSR
jgi:hypothetical protein